MIIECPTCHTNYDVGDTLPPEGRNVRCAACHDVWLAQPHFTSNQVSAEIPHPASYDSSTVSSQDINPGNDLSNISLNVSPESDNAEAETPNSAHGLSCEYDSIERVDASPDLNRDNYFDEVPDTSIGSTEATAKNFERHFEQPISNGTSHSTTNGTSNGSFEVPSGHDLNPTRPDPTSIGNRIEEAIGQAAPETIVAPTEAQGTPAYSYLKIGSWLVIISMMIAALLFALANPNQTARALPSTVGIYDALGIKTNSRGLEISKVKYDHTTFENRPALNVSGSIRNVTSSQVMVPTVIIELRDKDDLILFVWATKVTKKDLSAGAETPFNVTIPAPTKLVKNLKIRFSTRP